MSDPFEGLSRPLERQEPRPSFARELRGRLLERLGLEPDAVPTVDLPDRRTSVPTTTTTATSPVVATAVTPYLTAADGLAALAWYVEALGAVEELRVVGDDGRLGHAELTIGAARIMLSDEYPEHGVRSPATLGGPATTLHLTVTDVDALYARAVAAGATGVQAPADRPHGARHGTIVDPFGHRWMLSQPIEDVDLATYAERARESGFEVLGGDDGGQAAASGSRRRAPDGIWAIAFYEDALAAIAELKDVFGFEEQLVVVGDDGRTVVHSELRWPEGGVVQIGTYDPANDFARGLPPGSQCLYVITADTPGVWARAQAAGLEVVRPLGAPHHDPEGLSFVVRDSERNLWCFGSYGLAEA